MIIIDAIKYQTISKWDKILLKNQTREDRKGGKFSFKWLGPYTVHAISDKNICSLINKDGKLLKTKYNVSLLKPYVDADEIEVPCDEKPPISEITDPSESTDEQPAAYNKVDSSRSTAKLPLMEERIYNCVSADQQTPISWSDLPNEMVELILINAAKSSENATETYLYLSRTCSRFKQILQPKKGTLLPRIYMQFPDDIFESLPRWYDTRKVSVRKVMKIFGPLSGVAISLAKIVDNKKWKSAWLVINPEVHNWYTIERYYWKSSGKAKAIPFEEKKVEGYWLKNGLYHLYLQDKEILRSPTAWLNDRIMDAAQKLICKELGADDD